MRKIRKGKDRRENPGTMEQPATKKRKTGTEEYMRVIQEGKKNDKRKEKERVVTRW